MKLAERPRGPALAIDIGGTKLAAALVLADGRVTGRREVASAAADGGAAVLQRAIGLAEMVRAEGPAPIAVGVGTAGDVDPRTGAISFATAAIPAWRGTPVQAAFERALGLPTAVDNDGHVMALGEALHGAGRGYANVVGLTVGTGIGRRLRRLTIAPRRQPCGGVAQAGEPYLAEVRRTASQRAREPVRATPIVAATLGVDANLVGAAELAWQACATGRHS